MESRIKDFISGYKAARNLYMGKPWVESGDGYLNRAVESFRSELSAQEHSNTAAHESAAVLRKDGIYRITLHDGMYRAESKGGVLFFNDGGGHIEKVPEGTEVLDATPIGDLPDIKRNYNYGEVGWPLSEYFRRDK